MSDPKSAKRWWTAKDLAIHYGISVRTIYDAIAAHRLLVHRFGGGRGGIRVSDEDRLSWEQHCKEEFRSPTPTAPTLKNRLAMSELVAKHFGK